MDHWRSRAYDAGIDGGLLLGLVEQLPNTSRFGSFGTSAAAQCCGYMVHEVFPRVVQAAFPTWEDGVPDVDPLDNEDQEDYRRTMQKKVYRTKLHVANRDNHKLSAVLAFASKAVDRLWLEFESMDHRGNGLRDLADPRLSPVRRCIAAIEFVFRTPLTSHDHPLSLVFIQWGVEVFTVSRARGISASIAAQLWWRLCVAGGLSV